MKKIEEIEDLINKLGYGMIISDKRYYDMLKKQKRHFFTNTYDHCLRTAYLMYKLSGKKETIPLGLFHDFCERPIKSTEFSFSHIKTWYLFLHPEESVKNSLGMVSFYEDNGLWKNQKMERSDFDAVKSHMFPLSVHIPKTKKAWMLCIADKIVAISDIFAIFFIRTKDK